MKKLASRIILLGISGSLLSGCALNHEQVVQRAKLKSNAELCMATIQFPKYSDEIAAELQSRGHVCNWALTAEQVRASDAADARRRAALAAIAQSTSAAPAYKIVQPAPVTTTNTTCNSLGAQVNCRSTTQ